MSKLFSSVDMLPTLLGLCGIPVPDDVQGMDLSPAVLGASGEGPDSAYLQHAAHLPQFKRT